MFISCSKVTQGQYERCTIIRKEFGQVQGVREDFSEEVSSKLRL